MCHKGNMWVKYFHDKRENNILFIIIKYKSYSLKFPLSQTLEVLDIYIDVLI